MALGKENYRHTIVRLITFIIEGLEKREQVLSIPLILIKILIVLTVEYFLTNYKIWGILLI